MSEQYFFVTDSETGDLDPKLGDILTLYMAVTDDSLKVIDELDLKLKPDGGRMPVANEGALAVNKIDLQKHMADPNTITYSEAKAKITVLAKKYRKPGKWSNLIILGQNVGFDIKFIQEYIMTAKEWDSLFSYNVEDTKSACLFLKRCGWLPKDVGTLKSLVEFFNIAKREAHEAKGDVFMTIDVYKKMIEMMESKKGGSASQDLISLLEAE